MNKEPIEALNRQLKSPKISSIIFYPFDTWSRAPSWWESVTNTPTSKNEWRFQQLGESYE
tara:strand:- start:289 stop:468 length:180 start_codon:yes stop_codon:yes gene_type:complete